MQSKKSYAAGNGKGARREGVCAAYLSVAAIISALVVACVATGLAAGLYYRNIAVPL